ncbi:mucin-5AC [Labeo rohita]|uniref:mucin-5AC n=1 Tax=Labeo rohita TaxID=84645 RepID=UPI0021E1E590|nr:mucin-5AC [Labeo rohita]
MERIKTMSIGALIWVTLSFGLAATQTIFTTTSMIPTATIELISGVSSQHNGQVCSVWGNYHYKTFDGNYFQLPSSCNYILTSHCSTSYEDFNIQLRHQVVNSEPTISKITMKLQGTLIELAKGSLGVNGQIVTLPFSSSEVFIEKMASYILVKAVFGLEAMWNEDDSFMVKLDEKYTNQTCGLCGDFNGIEVYNEFISDGTTMSVSNYGNLWKMDGPTEVCKEDTVPLVENCGDENFCRDIFSSSVFNDCRGRVSIDSFVQVCMKDLCHCNGTSGSFCLCKSIAEYSRQCVHAGGKPEEWRSEYFCPHPCPESMIHQECGNPCTDTCTNPEIGQVCEHHCIDGCFCPPGTVFDDIHNTGCIPQSECSCVLGGKIFASGENYTSSCRDCTCEHGQWNCIQKDCPQACSIEGGSHITTYDGKAYTFHGDCTYILSKQCTGTEFTVQGDLVKCGLTETETCLKSVTLALLNGTNVIKVDSSGNVEVNRIIAQMPLFTADLSVFKPSSFYVVIQAHLIGLRLEIQLVPIMQLYITVNSVYQGETCGLCGNFNNIEADDFTTIGGLREGTAVDFANTWKTRASCPDVKRNFENPCSLSTENEKYAQHWCSLLSDPSSVFAPCHSEISPEVYKANCIYDTCNCERSEDCMCAALSSYVHACAARGIALDGWRDVACKTYTLTCPSTMVYSYQMTSCDRTCRSLSQSDNTCAIDFVPVDGCGCAEGTYMNENGDCVAPASCSCYYAGKIIPAGDIIAKDGGSCICEQGKLSCTGGSTWEVCQDPMTYFNCSTASPGSTGSECQKSCNTLDMACISTECVSGCVCPSGLVSDGKGGCIAENLCPCFHNGVAYQPGESIKTDCNTCTCKDRRWTCTTNQCSGTCSIYGDGHYKTFDEKRYVFSGNCEYSLVQDFCNNSTGTFRVITENIPCGSTGTTCSKSIKLFLGSIELRLMDGSYQVVHRDAGEEIPYQMRTMGLYLVIEANNGLMLIWDRKTTIHIKLSPEFNGRVCGLCGNYDGNANNDFTMRSQAIAVETLDFVNSWKLSNCPDATLTEDPCVHNPYREAWAQRQCSIITSSVFSTCHSQVDPSPFYDACVRDACACDSGGDYECFCTAVTAYAQACNEAGACVAWRTPKICPLFCDYYNPPGECEWHYKSCGAPCMQTCRNPSGDCSSQIPALEGCYPKCPPEQPIFDEDNMMCVAQEDCGCFVEMLHYQVGQQVPTTENCQSCYCSSFGVICDFDVNACICQYNNMEYNFGDTIYHTTDGLGGCITARCSVNGTIERTFIPCETTTIPTTTSTLTTTQSLTPTPTTVFVFSTPVQPSTESSPPSIVSTTSKSSTATQTTGQPTTTETVTENDLTTTLAPLSTTTRPSKVVTTGQTSQPTTTATTTLEEVTGTSSETATSTSTAVPVTQTSLPVVRSTQPTTLTTTTAVPVTTLVYTTVSVESSTGSEVSTQALSSTTKSIKAETTLSTTTPAIPSTTLLVEEESTTVQPSTESSPPSIVSTTSKSSTATQTTGQPTTTETVTEKFSIRQAKLL